MLGTDVENCLILVVTELEVVSGLVEVFFKHGYIIVLQGVIQRQVAIIVANVGSGADLINDWVLLVDAHDMLNCLSFEVLLATSLEKLVATREPVEDIFVAVAGALKQGVLSKIVFFAQCFVFIGRKDLEHLHILGLNGACQRIMTLKVRLEAFLGAHCKKFLSKTVHSLSACKMERSVSIEGISTGKDVEIWEGLSIHQIVNDFSFLKLYSQKEARFASSVPCV